MVPKPERKKSNKLNSDNDNSKYVTGQDKDKDKDANVKPPRNLVVSSTQMAPSWKRWKQQWKWYYTASGLEGKSNSVQIASFMSTLGPDVLDIYNSFGLKDEEDLELDEVIKCFDDFFIGKTNEVYERFLFNKITQENHQSFEGFCTKLVNQADNCNFGHLKDSLIRDRIVIGVSDSHLREKLLLDEKLTLGTAIKISKAYEQAKQQLAEISTTDNPASLTVTKQDSHNPPNIVNVVKQDSHNPQNLDFDCKRCGYRHNRGKCPAYNQTCNKCLRKGHFAKMCRSKISNSTDNQNRLTDVLEVVEENNVNFPLQVDHISKVTNQQDWIEPLILPNNKTVQFKLDTGAQCNVIPQDLALACGFKALPSPTKYLVSFNNEKTEVLGEVICTVTTRKSFKDNVLFVIVPNGHQCILGRASCEALGLVKRIEGLENQQTSGLFEGIGCLKSFVYDIDLIDNPVFKIHPPRRIPHPIRAAVKSELDKMVLEKIIVPVTEPTPCVSPIVVVQQKDKIRICMDPSDLNKNVKRRHYPLATLEDISARLNGSSLFTILDCKKGFWQIKVTERTSKFLTFSTPWGRYSCLRMPFGLVSAPEVFQQVMSDLLKGIDNVECSMDDILIHSNNEKHLLNITNKVMAKLDESGLTLNKEKCVFAKRSVKFLGHIVSENGLQVDPDKVAAISRMKEPTCLTELQRFLGCITYLSKFIADVSVDTQPLRALTEKNAAWVWDFQHREAFNKLKDKLQKAPVLRFYDPNSPVTLSVDSSSYAVGAVMLQYGQPVAYHSKALTQSQQNYSQLEKETFAILAACKRFHDYIWGCKDLLIETDHKPLEVIFKKPLFQAPPRIQRMCLEILPYRPKVVYKPGCDLHLADTLSRDCYNNNQNDEPRSFDIQIIIPMSVDMVSRIRNGILQSNDLILLQEVILNGWPNDLAAIDNRLRKYSTFRDELSCYDGLLFKGNSIIVPENMKEEIMQNIHRPHKGIQSSINTARDYVYWIGMEKDIEQYILRCHVCKKFQRDKPQDVILQESVPTRPWQFIGADIFECGGADFLVVADSYSGYFECEEIRNKSSIVVVRMLKKYFATHGIPDEVRTDGGPCFASMEFLSFVNEWNFNHRISSPHFPRSNGLSERYVQEGKNLITKCLEEKSDIHLALLHHRNTPRGNLGSPVQRLMSRRTKSLLPSTNDHLIPNVIHNVTKQLEKIKRKEKFYGDKRKTEPENFEVGEMVLWRYKPKCWLPAKIMQVGPEPRSYKIKTSDGREYRRNAWFLRRDKSLCIDNQSIQVNRTNSRTINHSNSPVLRRSNRLKKIPDRLDL